MRISDWSSDVCSSDLVGIEVGEEAVRLGGVGGTASATGSRGRRVGGHVDLGRVELAGRGIVAIGPEQITTPSALYRAAGIVVTIAVHQRSSPGSVHPPHGFLSLSRMMRWVRRSEAPLDGEEWVSTC